MLVNGSVNPVTTRALASEAVSSVGFFPGRTEDQTWRAINRQGFHSRELPPYTHDRMIRASFMAYRTNPLAYRLIEMQVNFVLGNGISLTASNPALMKVILDWWVNPWNNWPRKIHQRLRDIYIYGEWLHRPYVNATTGKTFIADIQPDQIEKVFNDPIQHSEIDSIVFKEVIKDQASIDEKVQIPVIRQRLDPIKVELSNWSGEIFLHGINRTTDTMRGIGQLFPVLDYIDMYDQILWARTEKIEVASQFYFDLEMVGKTQDEIQKFLAEETNIPPGPGSVWGHNEQAKMTMVAPDMKADDFSSDIRNIKSFIVNNMGWPGTWFDDPGSAGRAVASEMSEPALRGVTNLQAMIREFLRIEIDYVVAHAQKAPDGGLDSDMDPEYTITFNRPSARDIAKVAPALARLGQFAKAAVIETGTLTVAEARQVLVDQLNQLNITDTPLTVQLPAELLRVVPRSGAGNAGQDDPNASSTGNSNNNGDGKNSRKLVADLQNDRRNAALAIEEANGLFRENEIPEGSVALPQQLTKTLFQL